MADISSYLQQILHAIYGREVRGSIHDALDAMNKESSQAMKDSSDAKSSAKAYAEQASQAAASIADDVAAVKSSAALAASSAEAITEKAEEILATQTAAVEAGKKAESAASEAKQAAEEVSQTLERNQEVALQTPYVGENGNWFVWDNDTRAYKDSGTKAKGIQGERGERGEKGDQGEQGINGVAVTAEGQYGFNVNDQGHLILSYTGDTAPRFSIRPDDGHLIYEIG